MHMSCDSERLSSSESRKKLKNTANTKELVTEEHFALEYGKVYVVKQKEYDFHSVLLKRVVYISQTSVAGVNLQLLICIYGKYHFFFVFFCLFVFIKANHI